MSKVMLKRPLDLQIYTIAQDRIHAINPRIQIIVSVDPVAPREMSCQVHARKPDTQTQNLNMENVAVIYIQMHGGAQNCDGFTVTLAHEFGHAVDFENHIHPENFTEEEFEQKAWSNAKELLAAAGGEHLLDLCEFMKEDSLKTYVKEASCLKPAT